MENKLNIQNLLTILEFQISMGICTSPFESLTSIKDTESIANIRSGIAKYIKSGKPGRSAKINAHPTPSSNTSNNLPTQKQADLAEKQTPPNASLSPMTPSPNRAKNYIDVKIRDAVKDINTLQDLKDFVMNFDDCELKKAAINTVFADGNVNASVMLIGEAPGETEDETGIPFSGRSGALLDKALEAAGFSRKTNLYITNTVFWRPPGNRKPSEDEILMCKPILEKHISIIKPKIIILCGATAVEALLNKTGITKMNGVFEAYKNQYINSEILAVPIFHPSFLLRNPIAKKQVWNALLKIKLKYLELSRESS